MLAAVAQGHPLARRRRIRLAELAQDTWTAPSRDGLVVRACREAGFEPRLGYQTADPLAIRGLVAGGLAVALVPRLLTGELPGVRVLALVDPPRRSLYALTSAGGARALAGAFVEAARAAIPAGPPSRG
jgi:DNA-binding transcriptional LysR family regulator